MLLASLAPLIVFSVSAEPPDGLVALNVGGDIATLVLLLLAAGTGREPFFDLALVSAVLSLRRRARLCALPGALAVSVTDVLVVVLLGLRRGHAADLGASGSWSRSDVYDRLHFTGPASIFTPLAFAVAVVID